MPFYAVTYGYAPADDEARALLRPAHREFLLAQEELLLSGPTDDGALLIFESKTAGDLEEMLDNDPFWIDHLIAERSIVEWKPVSGPWREPLGLD